MAAGVAHPEIPPPARALLAWWVPRVRQILGTAYSATLVHGSVAMGDFQPAWSDVDVCVALHGPTSDGHVLSLAELQRETDAKYLHADADTWRSGQTIDAIYVRRDTADTHPESDLDPFDQLSLSTCALHLDGEAIGIPPPAQGRLRRRLRAFVSEAREAPNDASPTWHAAMLALLARALLFQGEGVLLSKTAALERAIARGGPSAEAYALGLAVRRAGSAAAAAQAAALRRAFVMASAPAIEVLGRLADDQGPE